jgi:hypothetical protein
MHSLKWLWPLAASKSASQSKSSPQNRSSNHATRPPAFATHHTRIPFDGKDAEPGPAAPSAGGPRESSNRQPCQGAAPARKRSASNC